MTEQLGAAIGAAATSLASPAGLRAALRPFIQHQLSACTLQARSSQLSSSPRTLAGAALHLAADDVGSFPAVEGPPTCDV